MDPYENLAIAIVQSAVSDYIARVRSAALKGYVDEDCNVREECMLYVDAIEIRKLISFFKSDYCYLLSGVDGDLIIEKANHRIKSKRDFKPVPFINKRKNITKPLIATKIETGEEKEFDSIVQCSNYFGVAESAVSTAVRYGKVGSRSRLKGWTFRFKKDVEA